MIPHKPLSFQSIDLLEKCVHFLCRMSPILDLANCSHTCVYVSVVPFSMFSSLYFLQTDLKSRELIRFRFNILGKTTSCGLLGNSYASHHRAL